MPNTVQGDSGISNLWDRSRVIFYEPAVHTGGIQDAIDEAEALAGADDQYGIAILIPPGDYSGQNLSISKSVALIGISPGATLSYPVRVGSVTVRPLSTISDPAYVRFLNIFSGLTLDVSNEVLGAPGTYNNDSPKIEMEKSSFATITGRGISRWSLTDCNMSGANQTYTVCEDVHFFGCIQVDVEWHTDDTASGLPNNYSGGNLNFKNCSQVLVDLFKDAGTVTAYFDARDTDFESITQNGDTDIRVTGGSVQSLTQLNANNNFLDYQAYAPYTPTTPGDWNVVPTLVQQALDEVASRLTAGML